MTSTNKSQKMWRSKLGNDYANDFMQANEAKLLKKLHQVRDQAPENRLCADCGTKGTVWASVNLGVFLCLTCGAHHRSLGTHISKPKGCNGTYWWGPDEIEQMSSIGNSKAREIYGLAEPPPGITKEDGREWKEYLMDKYVRRKFAAPKESRRPTAKENQGDDLKFFYGNRSRNAVIKTGMGTGHIPQASDNNFSFQKTKQQPHLFGQGNIDLISFEENLDSMKFASSSRSGGGAPSNPHPRELPSMQQNPMSGGRPSNNNDFFEQFGL